MKAKQKGGWKWVAGGLALIIAYQMGYDSGSERVVSAQPAIAESGYLAAADEPLMGSADAALPASADFAPDVPTDLNETIAVAAGADSLGASTNDPPRTSASDTPSGYLADPILSAANDDETGDVGTGSVGDAVALASSTAVPPPAAPSSYTVSKPAAYGCAENGSCYGDISTATGRPKTVSVSGYYRRDGTYVRGHYRSRPR